MTRLKVKGQLGMKSNSVWEIPLKDTASPPLLDSRPDLRPNKALITTCRKTCTWKTGEAMHKLQVSHR